MATVIDKISTRLKKNFAFLNSKKENEKDVSDDEHEGENEEEEGEGLSSSPYFSPSDPDAGENASSSDSSSEEIIERTYKPDSPLTFEAFGQQVSGHSKIFAIDEEKLAKPCNPHESQVYHCLVEDDIVGKFVPYFYGVIHVEPEEDVSVRYFQRPVIVLENLTAGFKHPCIMDLKMGRKGWDEEFHDPLEVKWRKIKANATTSHDLGFRLGGLRVYRPHLDEYLVRESRYGNRLRRKTLMAVLRSYLSDGQRTRVELIPRFIKKLTRLNNALKKNKRFDFRASSVLMIYEGDVNLSLQDRPKMDIRLIDFDHTEIIDGNDDEVDEGIDTSGVRWGVRNLIYLLRKIQFAVTTHHSTSNLTSDAHRRRVENAPDAVLINAPDDPVPVRTFFKSGTSPHPFRKYDSVPDLAILVGGDKNTGHDNDQDGLKAPKDKWAPRHSAPSQEHPAATTSHPVNVHDTRPKHHQHSKSTPAARSPSKHGH